MCRGVRLDVPPDAPLGLHAVRLATTNGISNLRIFAIDDLPQVLGMGMMGLGGLIAIIGGGMFVVVVLRAMYTRPSREGMSG